MKLLTLEEVKEISKREQHCDCPKCCNLLIEERGYQCSKCYHCDKTNEDCDNIAENWKCCDEDFGTDVIQGIKGKIDMRTSWCKKCTPRSSNLKSKKLEQILM